MARLILELPCGCKSALYDGDVIGIPFNKLPEAVASVISRKESAGCSCRDVDHQSAVGVR